MMSRAALLLEREDYRSSESGASSNNVFSSNRYAVAVCLDNLAYFGLQRVIPSCRTQVAPFLWRFLACVNNNVVEGKSSLVGRSLAYEHRERLRVVTPREFAPLYAAHTRLRSRCGPEKRDEVASVSFDDLVSADEQGGRKLDPLRLSQLQVDNQLNLD